MAELVDEMKTALAQLRERGLGDARPWSEFFEVFKPPSNWKLDTLERRMATNLMHYKTNYLYIVIGTLTLAIVLSPMTIFALTISAALNAYLFVFCKRSVLEV